MRNAGFGSAVVLATLALAMPVLAGPSNTPLPLFDGTKKTKHVFTVPGVMHTSTLATIFTCTVLDKNGADWGVEIFGGAGGGPLQNDVGVADNGVRGVGDGDTNSVSTANLAAIDPGDVITGLANDNQARSARIVATSTKLICSATVLDPSGNPPSVTYELPVIRKTTQKGD
jgi:hypothetical protein